MDANSYTLGKEEEVRGGEALATTTNYDNNKNDDWKNNSKRFNVSRGISITREET